MHLCRQDFPLMLDYSYIFFHEKYHNLMEENTYKNVGF